jgi:hypothetical protein
MVACLFKQVQLNRLKKINVSLETLRLSDAVFSTRFGRFVARDTVRFGSTFYGANIRAAVLAVIGLTDQLWFIESWYVTSSKLFLHLTCI